MSFWAGNRQPDLATLPVAHRFQEMTSSNPDTVTKRCTQVCNIPLMIFITCINNDNSFPGKQYISKGLVPYKKIP